MEPLFGMLGLFGGISMVILASNKAKLDRFRAERGMTQQPTVSNDSVVLSELKAIKQQMGEMQSTSHQFDLSFDAALNRLEGRVERLETKDATRINNEEPTYQRVGRG